VNIFEQLKRSIKETRDKMHTMPADAPSHALEVERLAALNMLADYIKSGAWTKKDGTLKRISIILKSPNYASAAQTLGCSEESARSSIYLASSRLKDKIGFDFIKEVMSGNISHAVDSFKLRMEKGTALQQLFPADVLAEFPKDAAVKRVDGTALLDAAMTLRSVSVGAIQSKISTIPENVLAVISALLHSKDPKHLGFQTALFQFFSLEIEQEELSRRLKLKTQ